MKSMKTALAALLLSCALTAPAIAGVTAEEAAKLKTTFTPFGAEKAGNKDGSIPAWTGGYTGGPVLKDGRITDPFANEKPLYTITAQNMGQYADRLTDGVKAMFRKYPDTFRMNVYPTHRTASAPQWVYDNTLANATRGTMGSGDAGSTPNNVYGGLPFPIARTGEEAIWNHLLRWQGSDWKLQFHGVLVTADGKQVLQTDATADEQFPYYRKNGSLASHDGSYWLLRLVNSGPPMRAGEGIVSAVAVDQAKTQTWVYLTGQRRTRKLPVTCCDTPSPTTAGIAMIDEIQVFSNRIDRFNWKLVGKKEMLIPYNGNRLFVPTHDEDVLGRNHLNPDAVRWELHRVWVVENELAPGQRHVAPRGVYYLDEDTWMAVLADRWDAKGQLWHTLWNNPVVIPEIGVLAVGFGFYDLLSGAWYANNIANEKREQFTIVPSYDRSRFTPESLASEALR